MSATARRWAVRLALALALGAGVVVGTSALDLEPEPVRVVLLVVLATLGAGVLLDATPRAAVAWYPASTHPPLTRGRDGTTASHLRHLENHQATRHPDGALRDRLRDVADGVLQVRHGVRADSDRGRALLGPELCEVLEGRVVRLSPRRIDQVLRMIEEL